MPDAEHAAQPPLERELDHDGEADILWLGNGRPGGSGFDLSADCIVFFENYPVSPSGFLRWGAKKVLLPLLRGEETYYASPDDSEVITYDGKSGTLLMKNGRSDLIQRDIFDGCTVLFDADQFVSSIRLERAAELLIPVLTAEDNDADGGSET